jgi:nitrite reductase (NADH) large subunit
MRIVVIGGSSAGGSLCETVRSLDASAEITLVSQEPWPMYSRCLIPKYINGERTRCELEFRPSNWAERLNVQVVVGRASHISPRDRIVELEFGERLSYDRLGIATGARAAMPPIPGVESRGVFDLYTLEVAESIKAWLPNGDTVVVLGAGLIGMKAAAAFTRMKKQVVLVEQKATVMPETLDGKAAEIISRLFTRRGVQVLTGQTICEVVADKGGRITSVRLDSGEIVECDMLVCAVGTTPNLELIRQAGGKTALGAIINQNMETSLPDIFAAGDVAEAPRLNTESVLKTANWFNSKREGRIAGYNMLGQRTPYPGRLRANAVELLGLPLVSVGEIDPEAGEEETWFEASGLSYRKLVFKDGRLVGFILLGEVAEAGVLTSLIQNARQIGPVRGRLLREGANCLPALSLKIGTRQSVTVNA